MLSAVTETGETATAQLSLKTWKRSNAWADARVISKRREVVSGGGQACTWMVRCEGKIKWLSISEAQDVRNTLRKKKKNEAREERLHYQPHYI